VKPDGIAEDGAVERITFSKSKETGRSDAANTLLFSAVPDGTPVRVRHVRTGEERPIEPAKHTSTKRAREAHLSHYERALRGIRLNVFPAQPEDAGDCADCAFLICGVETLRGAFGCVPCGNGNVPGFPTMSPPPFPGTQAEGFPGGFNPRYFPGFDPFSPRPARVVSYQHQQTVRRRNLWATIPCERRPNPMRF
jgi:hypothetical protein